MNPQGAKDKEVSLLQPDQTQQCSLGLAGQACQVPRCFGPLRHSSS